jgi:hypothetical protein
MELSKELQGLASAFSMLVITSTRKLGDATTEVIDYFTRQGTPGVLVTFSKPHQALVEQLHRQHIETSRLFFVDTIPGTGREREDNALHVQSPSALTDISIAISQFAHSVPGDRFVFVDAINALRAYNDDADIERFVGAIAAKSATLGLKVVLMYIRDPALESLERTVYQFFEKVVELG